VDHAVIAASVHQWRRRLSGCVEAGGGHFEHFFDLDVVFAAISATFLAVVDRFCLILMGTGNYSATSNNMKLVHWPLMCGLLHLVQRGGDWVGPQPVQFPPRCTKCNSPHINGQCTYHITAV